MRKNIFLPFLLFLLSSTAFTQSFQSPAEFLGYELGENFTRHYQVVDYFKHLQENSNQIVMKQYGVTYENRPLYYVIISSKENIDQMEAIRISQLKNTGLISGDDQKIDKAIVWLSYNIHGNESSSTEASMKTAYALLTGQMGSSEWLENTVVIIDPCVNPDGRDRYANFYWQYGAQPYNPSPAAVEHHEEWPDGRPNHYLFDLNRDWAWQTQQESEARMIAYHEWMPHIHVDFHEQSVDNPYYFAPAAEPIHEVITAWQRNFQMEIGKNHAKYFDQNNWLYFTRESFDLFYPSYGDTYPTFNGAIGMTYEQAGSGRAGLGVLTEFGDTLTLKDRIAHHYTTGMSTVEVASNNAERLNKNFKSYFDKNITNPADPFKAYVIKWSAEKAADIRTLKTFLDKQKIKYSEAGSKQSLKGYDYFERKEKSFTAEEQDLVISSYQPKSTLVQVLFDPKPNYSDSLTYDITAWALPYAYGLQTYGVKSKINANQSDNEPLAENYTVKPAYAYIIPYQSFTHAQLLADLLKENIKVKVSSKNVQFEGRSYQRGSLVITQRNNEEITDLAETLSSISKKHQVKITALSTGFADKIYDIGSAEFSYLEAPEVAIIMGDGVSSLNYGEIWHYFERQLQYPITSVRTDYLKKLDLADYDVIILPAGNYNDLKDFMHVDLISFVKNGGNVISLGSANSLWANLETTSLKTKKIADSIQNPLKEYKNAEREALEKNIFGAIYDVNLDPSHPLAYGYSGKYFSLKTADDTYQYLKDGWNVGYIAKDNYLVSGFAGYKANKNQSESLVFGVEQIGKGKMIYLVDDPIFRGFWHQGKLLFANAVFMTGQ